jgi:hypothetical protein
VKQKEKRKRHCLLRERKKEKEKRRNKEETERIGKKIPKEKPQLRLRRKKKAEDFIPPKNLITRK